jgi:hypothetical protein
MDAGTAISVCPPVNEDRIRRLRDQLDGWTSSPALFELVSLFEEEVPASAGLSDRLEWLERFSERWDFRRMARERAVSSLPGSQDAGGSARWEIQETGLSKDDETRVVDLADQLGLVSNSPPRRRDVDFLLILGGARLSNLLRPQYAAELIQASAVTPKHIVLLGGSRPVMDTERDATDSYAPQAETEFDLLTQGAAAAFNFDTSVRDEEVHIDDESSNANWQVWRFGAESTGLDIPISAIEAPSAEPIKRRATSGDSYEFFARRAQPVCS